MHTHVHNVWIVIILHLLYRHNSKELLCISLVNTIGKHYDYRVGFAFIDDHQGHKVMT